MLKNKDILNIKWRNNWCLGDFKYDFRHYKVTHFYVESHLTSLEVEFSQCVVANHLSGGCGLNKKVTSQHHRTHTYIQYLVYGAPQKPLVDDHKRSNWD